MTNFEKELFSVNPPHIMYAGMHIHSISNHKERTNIIKFLINNFTVENFLDAREKYNSVRDLLRDAGYLSVRSFDLLKDAGYPTTTEGWKEYSQDKIEGSNRDINF